MPVITNIVTAIVQHLKSAEFTPPFREVALSPALPAAGYPSASVVVEDELFGEQPADAAAIVTVTLGVAKGREYDSRDAARDLAHQLRRSLFRTDGVQGLVKSLSVRRISYSAGGETQPGLPVVARAELELEIKYCEPEA